MIISLVFVIAWVISCFFAESDSGDDDGVVVANEYQLLRQDPSSDDEESDATAGGLNGTGELQRTTHSN